uniref:HNH endonuclease n=1 Tax=candidate division WOR-3 bacterium TaxID=2052148 RepID=A0A7V3ZY46_UNCW3
MSRGEVLLLNYDYTPLNVLNLRKAVRLVVLKKAEPVYFKDGHFWRSERLTLRLPSVIRLRYHVHLRYKEVPLNKKNILRRDNYTCQYCGTTEGPMTIDHIVPKRLGGGETWENLVCACFRCNNRKGDSTPEEAGMKLLKTPKKPTYLTLLFSSIRIPDNRWREFLFEL